VSLESFLESLPYEPDPFQREAGAVLEAKGSVVVTAPTGAGKTLVAEMAIHLAQTAGQRVFYTTPIKALSNQKYGDLAARHGRDKVGLLTGDNSINGDAEIVVMTTEVLRNMIYADESRIDRVEFVILDEVHYLQDRFRGSVWEEVIIHAPAHVRMVALSATIANAEEFAGWIAERRGDVTLVSTTERPVPLDSMYLMADRHAVERPVLLPTFVTRGGRRRPNHRLEQAMSLDRGRRQRYTTPRRMEVIETLANEGMLPAIYFIFSRAGCDAAALTLTESGISLVDPSARDVVRAIAEAHTEHLTDTDLAVLEYGRWVAGLEAGIAAHHAGMVPAFKETVEDLFSRGLLKVVFATETLALGINMPARSVVLESLSKFDGEGHAMLTPGDYTQLTGRAGRRGIDEVGYGVVLHSRFVRLDQVIHIAETGSHPLRSSFRPTYNMAVNLIAKYPEERAAELLEASFAQYQREGTRSSAEHSVHELETRLGDERTRATCEMGSVSEYVDLIDAAPRPETTPIAGLLHPGDVVDVPDGRRAGRFLVLRRLARGKGGLRLLVLTTSGRTSTLGERDLTARSERAGAVSLPTGFRASDHKASRRILAKVRALPEQSRKGTRRGPEGEHAVAACPDAADHVRWMRRARRTEARLARLREGLRRSGVGLVEEFHAITALLEEWGYVQGWSLTPRGTRLRFVYSELDLLVMESIERGVLWQVTPAELAALATVFVYEPRSDNPAAPTLPSPEVDRRFRAVVAVHDELARLERAHGLPASRPPDAGFVAAMFAWAGGADLDDLPGERLSPGDFVRNSRQVVDLVKQIRDVVPELAAEARAALELIDRGVVAAQGVG
jgi:ATP-dependent RNA helicase HelY